MAAISSHGRTVIIVTWTFTGLTFISLTTYVVYLYLHPGMRFRPSDFIVFIAFLIGLALCGQITWAIVIEGWRYRQADFTSRQIHVIAQSLVINEILWTASSASVRVASGISLRKICDHPCWSRHLIPITTVAALLHMVASILEILFICRPISAQWDNSSRCGNQKLSFLIVESVGIALDVLLLTIPVYVLAKTDILGSWIKTAVIIEVGALNLVFSALRLKAYYLITSPDFIYSQTSMGIFSAGGTMLSILLWPALMYRALVKWLWYKYLMLKWAVARACKARIGDMEGMEARRRLVAWIWRMMCRPFIEVFETMRKAK